MIKKFRLCFGVWALVFLVFLMPMTAFARSNTSYYPCQNGYYYINVNYNGTIIARYQVSSSIGSERGMADGSSWCPSSLTLLSGTNCIALNGTPYTRRDGTYGYGMFDWNRQYILCYNFNFTWLPPGYQFDHIGIVDGKQVGAHVTGPMSFFVETDTNDNGMTNWLPEYGYTYHHSTFEVVLGPKSYPLYFNTNNPNTAANISIDRTSQTARYGSAWGALPQPVKPGYVFTGWYTAPSGGTQITSSSVCTGSTIINNNGMTVYAHWKPIEYDIQFLPNKENGPGTVTGSMGTVHIKYDEKKTLPANAFVKTTIVPAEDEGGEAVTKGSVFLGWSLTPTALNPSYADQAQVMNLTTNNGGVIKLYAIWDDTPEFQVASYPDRYFTLEEAQAGVITEEELLKTVEVYDREQNLLPRKTGGGNVEGITVVGYDPDEFLCLTDDGSVSVRYQVMDKSGNTAYLNITVYVSRNGAFDSRQVSYLRSVSDLYAGSSQGEGGFSDGSIWKSNTDYTQSLGRAMSGTTKTYDLRLHKHQLKGVRDYVGSHGFGNSESDGALSGLWDAISN